MSSSTPVRLLRLLVSPTTLVGIDSDLMVSSIVQDPVVTWPMPGLGGWRHRLLRILYATHLAPWLGGSMGLGTQRASRDRSHA
jgi:hypothetical protein